MSGVLTLSHMDTFFYWLKVSKLALDLNLVIVHELHIFIGKNRNTISLFFCFVVEWQLDRIPQRITVGKRLYWILTLQFYIVHFIKLVSLIFYCNYIYTNLYFRLLCLITNIKIVVFNCKYKYLNLCKLIRNIEQG